MLRSFLVFVCSLFVLLPLNTTPTSLYWTNCTTQTQEAKTLNLLCENYFTLFKGQGKGSSFSPDLGATVGLFKWKSLSSECGIDYLTGKNNDFFFNGKLALDEAALFSHSPSLSVGIFGVGTKKATKQNVVDLVVGKTLPEPIGGNFYLGTYHGAQALGKNKNGIMVGFEKGFCCTSDTKGNSYETWYILADYASGKNAIGGGGLAVAYYFSPLSWVEAGPVWFNDTKNFGTMKWGLQFNFGLRVFQKELRHLS